MIKAQLASGKTLEFPDGTDDSVIDATVRREMGIPEGGGAPISALGTGAKPPTLAITPGAKVGVPEPGSELWKPPVVPEKTLGERIIGEIPQVGGGMVAGVAAASAGLAVPVVAGTVALGALTGEAFKQLGQQLSGSLDAPKTSLDSIGRMSKAAVTEGGFELVGGLMAKGFGKIIAPLKGKLVKESLDAIDLFKNKIKPVVLLPAEATESRVLDLLQNVSEASIIGGSSIQEYKTGRIKFFDNFADSLIDEFGKRTDPTDLGNLFMASLNNSKAVHSKASRILYNSVKAGRAKTSTQSLKNFVSPMQKRAMKLEGIEAKNAGDDLLDAVMDLPDQLSFKEATELRSRLISRIDEFSVINKKAPAIGKAKKLVGLLDDAITKSLKGISPKDSIKVSEFNAMDRFRPAVKIPGTGSVYTGEFHGEAILNAMEDGAINPRMMKELGLVEGELDSLVPKSIAGYIDDYGRWMSTDAANRVLGLPAEVKEKLIVKELLPKKGTIPFGKPLEDTDRKLIESIRQGDWYRGDDELLLEEITKRTGIKFSLSSVVPVAGKVGVAGKAIDLEKDKIVKAAFKLDNGKVITGTIHAEAFDEVMSEIGKSPGMQYTEGFVTKSGKFISTVETRRLTGLNETKEILKSKSKEWAKNVIDQNKEAIRRWNRVKSIGITKDSVESAKSWSDRIGINTSGSEYTNLTPKNIDLIIDQHKKLLKGGVVPAGRMISKEGAPTALEAWRTANRFYKDGQKKFNNTLLRRLVKLADDTGTGAEMIAPAIFKPRHVTSVRKVKTALKDDPETWRKMQGFFMQYFMQKSSNKNKEIVGTLLINNMSDKPGSFGMPMLQEVFTEPQIKALRTFGQAVKLTQERQAQGAGRVLIQLTQAGALGAILTGNLALPAATIIIAPAVMAKMMLNPTMAKLLTTGLTLPAKAPQAAGIMSRLAAAAWRVNQGEENETIE